MSQLGQPLVWAVRTARGFWVSLVPLLYHMSDALGFPLPVGAQLHCGPRALVSWPGNSKLQGRQGSKHRTHVPVVLCQDGRIPRDRDIVINLFDDKQILSACSPVSCPVPDEAEIKNRPLPSRNLPTDWIMELTWNNSHTFIEHLLYGRYLCQATVGRTEKAEMLFSFLKEAAIHINKSYL